MSHPELDPDVAAETARSLAYVQAGSARCAARSRHVQTPRRAG